MKKEPDYEEFLHLMLECYEAFKEVMQKGTQVEKMFAMKGFYTLQQMIKDRVSEVSDKKGIDPKEMERLFLNSENEFSKVCKETKEELLELKQEIDPLLAKARAEKSNLSPKKQRKRSIEKKLRVKG